MPIIQETLDVPYNVAEMYELVNDIAAYTEFLPWCTESKIIKQDEDAIQAKLTLRGGGFSKSFTTSNRLQKDKMVEISLIDGPFKHLEGFWAFEPTKKGCKVRLNLEFEFASPLLAIAFSPVFEKIAQSLTKAFSDRAKQVYGKR
ncbi:type II toxin-antitoxin system RatA family toxin [Rickettsiella endosymbiont of Dermanyssus gallinae]|uniref:type II toxin-antitoxin system RatA family toxin n=1 Tax=Rickettsiella endosymbiont of Dermanyssus gallinae TaxID=2856608 RepID=UPI001C52D220|nr:type II toxin-antitoxin system RatA family toxin [Rickettsiella endosymbiont of Dermanyssus gallinae]